MLKKYLWKDSSGTIQPIAGRDKWVHAYFESIRSESETQ